MHKDVKTDRDIVGADAIFLKRFAQIAMASAMRVCVSVNDPEGIGAARCEQKIVSSYGIFNYPEHNIASVRIERMTLGQKNGFSIVNRSS
jgi:hypothetical protein